MLEAKARGPKSEIMTDLLTARRQMIDSQLRSRGISDSRVLASMLCVPREVFVPEESRAQAFEDHPLPIGEEQTISQPYVVAAMLQSLQLQPGDIALEVGTGSGYVTALLAELAAQVFSVERHASLADRARETIAALGYTNVRIFTADGSLGLPAYSPFDAIIVSAAALHLPQALLSQLREGGRMIIPVGPPESQQLQFIRMYEGQPVIQERGPVRFVPLVTDRSGQSESD